MSKKEDNNLSWSETMEHVMSAKQYHTGSDAGWASQSMCKRRLMRLTV